MKLFRIFIFALFLITAMAVYIFIDSHSNLAIKLPDGYNIEKYVSNLSVPTTAIFDGTDLLIAESGWKNTAAARVIKVTKDGKVEEVAGNGLEGPVTGLLVYKGSLYVSHKGKVSIVQRDKTLRDIVTGLPSQGDHQNNNIVLGPDNKIYMGQGTVTNSGVVGEDNYWYAWLDKTTQLHDVPCKDIQLNGQNFQTDNPLSGNKNKIKTGAYKPFGTQSRKDEIIDGQTKCSGAILRFNPDGTGLEVVAWGLRNPFGLEFDSQGTLWATNHGADVRGSRPIFNDPDYLFRVEKDAWYGWPDYFNGVSVNNVRFKPPTKSQPQELITEHPTLNKPYLTFNSHEGINGIVFSPGGVFGYKGDAFIAMFGTMAPATSGVNAQIAGFRVVRVDIKNKKAYNFASNTVPGPAYINRTDGFDRPSDVLFGPDGALYVIDWGASVIDTEGLKYVPGTGEVWRIYSDKMKAARGQGSIVVKSVPVAQNDRIPEARNVKELYKDIGTEVGLLVILIIVIITILTFGIYFLRKRK